MEAKAEVKVEAKAEVKVEVAKQRETAILYLQQGLTETGKEAILKVPTLETKAEVKVEAKAEVKVEAKAEVKVEVAKQRETAILYLQQ